MYLVQLLVFNEGSGAIYSDSSLWSSLDEAKKEYNHIIMFYKDYDIVSKHENKISLQQSSEEIVIQLSEVTFKEIKRISL